MSALRLLLIGPAVAAVQALASRARERGALVTDASGNVRVTEDTIERAFEQAGDALSGVVHVLSVPGSRERVGDWSLQAWEHHVVSGLRSAYLVARRSVEEFLAGGDGGRLLFLLDAEGPEGDAAREILRGGLLALVRSVAKEYGPRRIGCNAVVGPGGGPECVAETAWTLLTPEGAYVTGEVIDLTLTGR